jgi:hypothetical protein
MLLKEAGLLGDGRRKWSGKLEMQQEKQVGVPMKLIIVLLC